MNSIAVPGREIGRYQHFERFQPLPAIGFRFLFTSQHLDDVVVVEWVAESIYRCGFVVCLLGGLIIGMWIIELPVLYLVDRNPTDTDGAFLADNGNRTFEILGVGQHGNIHGTQCPGAPAHIQGRGVFHVDVPGEGCDVGADALDRTDEPIEQIDIVAGLVHQGAAVKLPGAAPGILVVVFLGASPEDVDVDHVDTAKAPLFYRSLQQLQGGVFPVLFDDQQHHARPVAGLDHFEPIPPAGGHGFFRHHMDAVTGDFDGLGWVDAAGRRQHDDVEFLALEQSRQA